MSDRSRLHASIIVTYRCNAKCNMCDVWRSPTNPAEEIGLDIIEKLPKTFFTNITGGEPFVRKDLVDLVGLVRRKTRRIVISTNGYFTDRIISLCRKYPDVGIRISIEGLSSTNDTIRGIPDGFDRGLRTLLELRAMGIRDIGFAMTVQDLNCRDLIPLYHLAKGLRYEFATATLHNSHYFHKLDNRIEDPDLVCGELARLVRELLRSRRPKDWFRAYFNWGLINYVRGKARPLPCEMGDNGFFVDPSGDVLACNGMDEKQPMGNLRRESWEQIWNGQRAMEVRQSVRSCRKNCWMIGSAAPAMWKRLRVPAFWVLRKRLRQTLHRDLGLQAGSEGAER